MKIRMGNIILSVAICMGIFAFAKSECYAAPHQFESTTTYWEVQGDTLYITGTGAMPDYEDSYDSPMQEVSGVTKIVFSEGITRVGDYCFNGMQEDTVISVQLPSTLKSIGNEGLSTISKSISSIDLPEGLESLGSTFFGGNGDGALGFNTVTIPSSVTTIIGFYRTVAENGTLRLKNPNATGTNYNLSYVPTSAKILVPKGSVEAYKQKYSTKATQIFEDPDSPNPSAPSEEEDNYYLTPLEDELEALVESFKQTPSIEPTTVTWDKGDSLPLNIMETLKDNPSISLLFDFEYEGVKHTVLIPAGKAFVDESIPWYGPLWLLQTFGEYDPNYKGVYTVQSGDTLGDIARANGITLEELLKKNPQIANVNLIYPGDEINL